MVMVMVMILIASQLLMLECVQSESSMGMPAARPVIELTVPSALDNTIAPPGKHVVQLFVQFVPYDVDPKVCMYSFMHNPILFTLYRPILIDFMHAIKKDFMPLLLLLSLFF